MEEKEERGTAACSAPGVILRRISRVRNRIEDIHIVYTSRKNNTRTHCVWQRMVFGWIHVSVWRLKWSL